MYTAFPHDCAMPETLKKRDYFDDPTLPLQVHIRDPHPVFPRHAHAFDELVIVFRGTAVHSVDGQPFPVRSGDVFVVSGKHEHQFGEMHGLALANILFDSRALQMNQWDIRMLPGFHALFELEPALRAQHKFNSRLYLPERQLNRVSEMVHDLKRETETRTPGYRVVARALFMQLAVYLSRCYSDTPPEESTDLIRLGSAIAHIETHFQERLTLEMLARKAHLSPRHFQRIFSECTGHSPIDYLLRVRVREAGKLLRHSNRSITEIAFDCGFQDSNYFTRQFKKIAGETPLNYRKKKS